MAKVLILYNEWEQADGAVAVCRQLGHLSVAVHVEQALFQGLPQGFDLVILASDAPLPALGLLGASAPDAAVIAIVTFLGDQEASGLRAGGVKTILFRPYHPQTLEHAMAEELRWAAAVEPPPMQRDGLQAP